MEEVELIIVKRKYMLAKNLSKESKLFIELLSFLSERDSIILIQRFKYNKSLKEVAKDLGVSNMAIKEREDRLLTKIDRHFDYVL